LLISWSGPFNCIRQPVLQAKSCVAKQASFPHSRLRAIVPIDYDGCRSRINIIGSRFDARITLCRPGHINKECAQVVQVNLIASLLNAEHRGLDRLSPLLKFFSECFLGHFRTSWTGYPAGVHAGSRETLLPYG
jgi:hypothetical protein